MAENDENRIRRRKVSSTTNNNRNTVKNSNKMGNNRILCNHLL